MQFQFSFKQLEKSPLIQNYAQKKLVEKLQRFVIRPIELNVTFSKDKYNYITKCSFLGSGGINVEVQHACADIYGCIDKLADKLLAQVKKQKDKIQSSRFRKNKLQQINLNKTTPSLMQESTYDADDYVDAEDILKFEKARQKFITQFYS